MNELFLGRSALRCILPFAGLLGILQRAGLIGCWLPASPSPRRDLIGGDPSQRLHVLVPRTHNAAKLTLGAYGTGRVAYYPSALTFPASPFRHVAITALGALGDGCHRSEDKMTKRKLARFGLLEVVR